MRQIGHRRARRRGTRGDRGPREVDEVVAPKRLGHVLVKTKVLRIADVGDAMQRVEAHIDRAVGGLRKREEVIRATAAHACAGNFIHEQVARIDIDDRLCEEDLNGREVAHGHAASRNFSEHRRRRGVCGWSHHDQRVRP